MPAVRAGRALGSGLLVLLLAASAGCAGGGAARGGDVSVVARGADRTLGARTFRFETTLGSPGGTLVMSGAFDTGRKIGGAAVGRGGAWPPDQIIGPDGKTYQRREMVARSLDVRTGWAAVDPQAVERSLGGPPPAAAQEGGVVNPATLLADLRSKAERVERTGSDTVRGVTTTRYEVTMKPVPEPSSALTQQESMTLWVGDDGLVRRLEDRTAFPAEGGVPGPTMTSTTEFFDFGVPVDVAVPPASDTTDITNRVAARVGQGPMNTGDGSSVTTWSTVTAGTVGPTRWTYQQGRTPDGTVCTRLRLDPPAKVPSVPNGSVLPSGPGAPPLPAGLPGAGTSPDGTVVPPAPPGPVAGTGDVPRRPPSADLARWHRRPLPSPRSPAGPSIDGRDHPRSEGRLVGGGRHRRGLRRSDDDPRLRRRCRRARLVLRGGPAGSGAGPGHLDRRRRGASSRPRRSLRPRPPGRPEARDRHLPPPRRSPSALRPRPRRRPPGRPAPLLNGALKRPAAGADMSPI